MPHNQQNISNYHAGDALTIPVTVQDENENVLDISNPNSIEWYLKENSGDTDANALLSKTLSGGGITVTDGPNGKFEITIDTGETDSMSGQKHHRARLTDSDGDRSTIFTGTLTISV